MRLFGPPSPAPRVAFPRPVESLERRVLFHLELVSPLADTAVAPGTGTSTVELTNHFNNEEITGTIVRLKTDLGPIDVELDDVGPTATVQNFLGYVSRGAYDNTFFHRAFPNFVVQGGGYNVSTLNNPVHIPEVAPITNEFSFARRNLRGTVAMAKREDDPNSATSEFFVNLADNTQNDVNNGGYTVFGAVINNSMPVVDTINGLPKFDPPAVPFPTLPLQGSPPATADKVVKIGRAVVLPEAGLFNYVVQSTDPELVTPVVEDGVLRLIYGPGRTGKADVTITATDVAGTTVTDSFTAAVGTLDVQVGDGAAKQATFTDADGTAATISLKGGTGTLRFTGANLSQNVGKAGAVVLGTITDLAIDMTNTGTGGALAVKASGGDGLITVNRLTSDAGMKSIAGKQLTVVGDVTIAGAAGKVDFGDVRNSTMSFGGSGGGGLTLSLRAADAVDVVSLAPIKSLKAASFAGGGPEVGVITAPALGSLTIDGDFNQRLNVAGALGSAKIGGAVNTFLPWTVGGSAGKLAVGSVTEGFIADFLGGVASLAVAGNFTGDVSATAIKSLAVKGEMNSANLILTGGGSALGKATVGGAITNSRIQASAGSIGSVTAASINASTIYAGVSTDGGALPVDGSDFGAGASGIGSITVKGAGGAPSFVNSNVAARTLGRLNLGVVQVGNAGVPFGVAGDTISTISATGNGPLRFSRLTDPADTTAQQDFEVRVF